MMLIGQILENPSLNDMTKLYQNKYRNDSTRHPYWDYASNGAYFITVCTKDRVCWLGEVVDGIMNLSPIGELLQSEWYKTPDMRLEMNLKLGAFQVMPNHFHGIIIIAGDRDATHCVPIPQFSPSSKRWPNQFGPQSKNLASIIRGIKSSVTTQVRKMESDALVGFAWQSRFHDHIIRDEASYQRISNYIIQNPGNWDKDKFHL